MEGSRGFSLTEVMISVFILAFVFIASVSLLQFHRLTSRKAQEQAVMLDFCQHYMELARNQPYDSIVAGQPINALFNGQNGTPSIVFPANDSWQSLWTTNYRTFHPDLAMMENRSPEFRCQIITQMNGTTKRARHVIVEARWIPPLERGADRLTVKTETVVYPDFN